MLSTNYQEFFQKLDNINSEFDQKMKKQDEQASSSDMQNFAKKCKRTSKSIQRSSVRGYVNAIVR